MPRLSDGFHGHSCTSYSRCPCKNSQPAINRGDRSKSMRILDMKLVGDSLVIQTEGPVGREFDVWVAREKEQKIIVRFEGTGDPIDGYVAKEVRIPLP